MPTHHELFASPETVHWGYFDARLAPVLSIASGDTVTLTSVSGGRNILPPDGNGMFVLPEHLDIHARHTAELGPHILTGPIYIAGAKPGDTLEVHIKEIEPRQNWAYNTLRGGALPEDFGNMHRPVQIAIDLDTKTAHPPWGGRIPLSPFFGNMGTAPAPGRGRVSSAPPGEFGGNMDIKDLVAGSILYLPVFNDGALFSAGDGHGAQGDGEVCSTAIETALRGTFEFIVRKDLRLTSPRGETPTHWITMAFDPDLNAAAKTALREMLTLLGEKTRMAREDAFSLMSLACDLHISQMVNGPCGVHAMISKVVLPE